jgi:hypothetical protein
MDYLWQWFMALHNRRGSNGFSALPISWEALDAWARRMQIEPTPWEVETIFAVDDACLTVKAEQAKAEQQRRKAQQKAAPRVRGRR